MTTPDLGNRGVTRVQRILATDNPDGIAIRIEPPHAPRTITVGHGLYYIHRDGQGFTALDRGDYRQTAYPRIPQPERDIARALLTHALRELDAMDEADGGRGTIRG